MTKLLSIGSVPRRCSSCGWSGILAECTPDVDGEGSLGCPRCGRVVPDVPRDMARIEQHLQYLDARDVACNETPQVVLRRHEFVANLHPLLQALSVRTVLDAGCAGITRPWWHDHGYEWRGLTLPRDAHKLLAQGIPVDVADVASMPYGDGAFDLVYASHVLEHSPMPLVALLEIRRVAKFLAFAVPRWPRGKEEPYHYSVAPREMWQQWLDVSRWAIVADFSGSRDFEFLCIHPSDATALDAVKAPLEERRKRLEAREQRKAEALKRQRRVKGGKK